MQRGFLACFLFVSGCSSSSGGARGDPDDDAAAGRDATAASGDDASLDAAQRLVDAGFDAAADAALDAGLRVLGRGDMAGLALNGTIPPADVAAPEFAATAHTGEPRTRADLLGRRTVMWFYPQAYTGG